MPALNKEFNSKNVFQAFLATNIVLIALWGLLRRDAAPNELSSLFIRQSAVTRNYDYKRLFSFPNVDFSSRFSSGHLKEVISRGKNKYTVLLGSDPRIYNTTAVNKNWFYFRVSGKGPAQTLKLEVRNLLPNWSVWKNGMAIAYRSSTRTRNRWRMFTGRLKLELSPKSLQLRFRYRLRKEERVEFALTYPYTRLRLSRFLTRLQKKASAVADFYFARETLTLSSLNYTMPMLRLSSAHNITRFTFPRLKNLFPLRTNTTDNRMFSKSKCNIILAARVHPAETAASFMLEGLLEYLVDNAARPDVRLLFERCVLTVVPMLNPDGVELGFTRTDLHGYNLNSIYQEADVGTPTIYALRKVVRYLDTRNNIRLFLDFHTHMTKRGFFMFGNPLREETYRTVLKFPFLVKRVEAQLNLKSCGFGSKKFGYTSRKEFANKTQIENVYTVETNYWGPPMDLEYLKRNRLVRGNTHLIKNYKNFYTQRDFRNFGRSVAKAIVLLIAEDPAAPANKMARRIEAYYRRVLKPKNFH